MAFVSQDRYLSNIPDIRNAFDGASAAALKLRAAKEQLDATSTSNKNYALFLSAYKTAKKNSDDAEAKYQQIRKSAIAQYNQEKQDYERTEQAKKQSELGAQASTELTGLREQLQRAQDAGLPTAGIESQIQAVYNRFKPQGPTGPNIVTGPTSTTGSTSGTGPTLTDANAVLTTISDNEEQLRKVQEDLKKNFSNIYSGGTNGFKDWFSTRAAIEKIAQYWDQLPPSQKGDFRTYLLKPTVPIPGATGTGTGVSNISNKEEAQSLITSVFKSITGRDPQANEISSFTQKLNSYEKKNPTVNVSGKLQFLTNEIKTLPEYAQKLADVDATNAQAVKAAMRANGLVLNDADVANYVEQIRNGAELNVVKNRIRSLAANTQPESVKKLMDQGVDLDTIYSPYKSAMASILEIPSTQIELNDPTLMQAINQQGTIPLYEFQRSLRKDPRWQYTNNAKSEISNSVLKVLQDFGFRG